MGTGQAHELALAFARNGWTPADVKRLSEGNMLEQVHPFVRGCAEINTIKHIIDLSADPHSPNGWAIEEHRKGNASFEFDPNLITFHLSEKQKGGKIIEGNKLRKELKDLPVFNANLLDYLLKNPNLIPEEWKKDGEGNTRYIFFWGTIYRSSDGNLCVRCLCWNDGQWYWDYRWLDGDWLGSYPAACLASEA